MFQFVNFSGVFHISRYIQENVYVVVHDYFHLLIICSPFSLYLPSISTHWFIHPYHPSLYLKECGLKVGRRPINVPKCDFGAHQCLQWPSWICIPMHYENRIALPSCASVYPCKESATEVSSSSRDAGNVLSDILLHDFACGKMSAVKDSQFIGLHFLVRPEFYF